MLRTRGVALASMPFAPSAFPSLAIGSLSAVLRGAGVTVRAHYAGLAFLAMIGREAFDTIAQAQAHRLVGDWIFSAGITEQSAADVDAYVAEILEPRFAPAFAAAVINARELAPQFVERIAGEVLAGDPAVVGFSTLFTQHAASLAAAKRIKELRPDVAVVFGGANCEGAMGAELVRRFPFVDAVVSGEAEEIVLELVTRLAERRSLADLAGVATALTAPGAVSNTPRIRDLDALPIPDYADFYDAVQRTDSTGALRGDVNVLVEASRGCWWGEKHHCTFCGLNGSSLAYRSKSPARFVEEVCILKERYDPAVISATDNILDYRYYGTALPMLAERNLGVTFAFEVKANIQRAQMELLDAAGIRALQPGIESLDTGVLRTMRKGCTALQNIRLLKLCRELATGIIWNIIFGFPGEDPAAYARMAALVPLLTHLPPPDLVGQLRLDRFSPLYDQRDDFGLVDVRPVRAYRFVYGGSDASLARLAYYFDFAYADGRDPSSYTGDLVAAVAAWRARSDDSDLLYVDDGTDLLLIDRRGPERRPVRELAGLDRAVYIACDDVQGAPAVVAAVQAHHPDAEADAVIACCRRLVAAGVMLEEDGRYLSLGLSFARGGTSRALRRRIETLVSSGFDAALAPG